MKFLAVSQNTKDPTQFLAAEGARMAELTGAGTVEQVFLKADYSGAVLIAHAADATALADLLSTLPLVINGITSFALTEIVVAGDS
jgi:hypothetical protein